MINQITDETGADISIEDDGTVYIGATDGPSADAARAMINAIANPTMPEKGERYLGTVVKTTNFGAFISLLPGKDGLLHISKLRGLAGGKRVEAVEDILSVGQKLQVEIAEIDDRGKLSLIPVLEGEEDDKAAATTQPRPMTQRPLPPSDTCHHQHAAEPGGGRSRQTDRPALRASRALPVRTGLPLGHLRRVGRRRFARRTGPAVRRHALPRAPAVQGHRASRRAGDLGVPGRRRWRDERVHRQGVHLLLRPGARLRPSAGRRRDLRHDHLGDAHARRTSRASGT